MPAQKTIAVNSGYFVHIKNPTAGVDLLCDLPDRFSLGAQSQFDSIDLNARSVAGAVGLSSIVQGSVGNIVAQELTRMMWVSTSPIEFTLPLIFDARESSFEDVHRVYCNLFKLTLPVLKGGLLYAPNETRVGSENKTSIRLGRQFYFDSVIVTSVNITSESRLNKGYPIAGQIDMSLSTNVVYGRTDFVKAAGL